jgi:hypothetical protein
MKTKILFSIFFLLIMNFTSFAIDKEADKIIEKYLKAIGGRKNWEKINTIKFITHLKGMESHTIFKNKEIVKDKGIRIEDVFEQGTAWVSGFNNKEGWRVTNGLPNLCLARPSVDTTKTWSKSVSAKEVMIATKTEVQITTIPDSIYQAYKFNSSMPWLLMDYQKKGYTALFKGKSYLEGMLVSEIELSLGDKKIATYFFDDKNNYLLKLSIGTREWVYSNFREIEHIIFPFEESEIALDIISPFSYRPVHNDYIVDRIILNPLVQNENIDKPTN